MPSRMEFVAFISVVILVCGIAAGQTAQIELRIEAPEAKCSGPVNAQIELPEQFASVPVEQICVVLKDQKGISVPGQVVVEAGRPQLWWMLPCEKAGVGTTWTAVFERQEETKAKVFSWKDKQGEHLNLLFNGRPVMQYVYARDTSTPQRDFETNKPFYNIFDLAGRKLITNCDPNSLYPHHRGLFIGWQRISCGDEHYNFWGMGKLQTAQVHKEFLEVTAGPVLARVRALIHWDDRQGNTIIAEERQMTAFAQVGPSIMLMELKTTLKAVKDTVILHSNNPAKAVEHGGVQFRPHNDVSGGKGRSSTHRDVSRQASGVKYLFHTKDVNPLRVFNLPWVAMSYGLGGRDYTVQHINHPSNPRPTFYSAYRDYGRFGAYFERQIKVGESLTVTYWLWALESKMPSRGELARHYSAVMNQPEVELVSGR